MVHAPPGFLLVNRWAARRQMARGQVDVFLRVADGQQPGLTDNWRFGSGTPTMACLIWQPYVNIPGFGLRIKRGSPLDIEVSRVDRTPHRTLTRVERDLMVPFASLLRLDTASAELEIVAHADTVDYIASNLSSAG